MTEAEEFVTGSIDDYLMSLADGIFSAQSQLNQLRVAGPPGQPSTTYYLPKVEFELKLAFEMVRQSGPGTALRPGGEFMLKARSVSPAEMGGQDVRAQAASVIRGAFVAVPADGGKPQPLLRTSLLQRSALEVGIVVQVFTAIGDPVPGVEVHFNVDRDASLKLNQQASLNQPLEAATDLMEGVVVTDARGGATSILKLAPDELVGGHVALTIDALGVSETIVYRRAA